MKLLIYGIGERYKKTVEYIRAVGDIVAYVDNYHLGEEMPDGKHVISFQEAVKLKYDKILITSNKYGSDIFNEIKNKVDDIYNKVLFLDEILNAETFIKKNYLQIQKHVMLKNANKKINYKYVYVLCPAYSKTGGPELLHQLVATLRSMHINAKIAYDGVKNTDLSYTPQEYKHYVGDHICKIEEVEDSEQSLIVIPEVMPGKLKKFKKSTVYFWWLSVDNILKCSENYNFEDLYIYVDRHLYQSEYARQFLVNLGISSERMYELTDYLSDEYLTMELTRNEYNQKKNIVIYNPAKESVFLKKIRTELQGYQFMPIQNMTRREVFELQKQSKVYVDFGSHPGKDRIPREAAVMGCCVITGTRGSAKNLIDVPIGDEYKFDEENTKSEMVEKCIMHCMNDYDICVRDFEEYREKIKHEKIVFIKQVERIFTQYGNS